MPKPAIYKKRIELSEIGIGDELFVNYILLHIINYLIN